MPKPQASFLREFNSKLVHLGHSSKTKLQVQIRTPRLISSQRLSLFKNLNSNRVAAFK
jgi:hypothetical protein